MCDTRLVFDILVSSLMMWSLLLWEMNEHHRYDFHDYCILIAGKMEKALRLVLASDGVSTVRPCDFGAACGLLMH